MTKQLASIVE